MSVCKLLGLIDGGTKEVNLRWDYTNDRLGMGNIAPRYPLDIQDNSNVILGLTSTSASGSNAGARMRMICDDGAAIDIGDMLGKIYWDGSYNASNNTGTGASIDVYATEAFSSGHYGSRIAFSGSIIASGTTTEWATLYEGCLGVGTVAPTHWLEVVASSATKGIKCNNSTVGSSGGGFLYLTAIDGTIMLSGERLGGILYQGSRDSSNNISGAGLVAYADENWVNSTSYGTKIQLEHILSGATSRTVALSVDKTGSLRVPSLKNGSGTTHPVYYDTTSKELYYV